MKKEIVFFLFILGLVLLLSGCSSEISNGGAHPSPPKERIEEEPIQEREIKEEKMTNLPLPEMEINPQKKYQAVLRTTAGEITIDLFADKTPKTVNNFVYLSKNGFYNGTIFHRVIKDFMIQGGDPKGNGTGGPGYKFADEPFEGEYLRGTVAMANSGPDTNGSQFFIMHQDYNLPKNYVIFGQVVEGLTTVDQIAEAEVTRSASNENSKPIEPVKIESVEILSE